MEDILKLLNVKEFTPIQKIAIDLVLKDKNVLAVAPTASGKTLIGELAMLKAISKGKRAIYVSPLRALTSEKYEDFKRFGIKNIGISTGDLTQDDAYLKYKEVVFLSIEKLDSLLRKSVDILENLGAIVFDEVHLINDEERGPTLEFLIALINYLYPKAQKIYLSATIGNPEDLSNWLKAELAYSDFRPVKLIKKIALYDRLIVEDTEEEILDIGDQILNVVNYLVSNRKQFILFSPTRNLAESYAEKISILVNRWAKENQNELISLSEKLFSALDIPTKSFEKLAKVVRNGVAFHHAGLLNEQRKLIEEKFKEGLIKAIAATPTLAMGVNLPANTVVISSIYRRGYFSTSLLPVYEVEQMAGRAGRPKYDKEGTVIFISRNERDTEIIKNTYLNPELEPIKSKFSNEKNIRVYTLALISMNLANNQKEIEEFFSKLYSELNKFQISQAIEFLKRYGFIIGENKLLATPFGKLVSELYIDPITAIKYKYYLSQMSEDEFSYLHALMCASEVPFQITPKWIEKIEEEIEYLHLDLNQQIFDFYIDDESYYNAIYLAHVLYDWINEKSEAEIEDVYGIQPGILYQIVNGFANWLSYSMYRLALSMKIKSKFLREMQIRIQEGVKSELLNLVSIPQVGRVRARKLFKAGIKTKSDIKSAGIGRIKEILGPVIGENIYNYCVQNINEENNKLL
ncbi:MAG: DEAD/DEAH box helicase [Candidatus Rehaiarchaeum fermentans]|nr:DEAD/DEAH box helicase [Candidatus Rehaiarchaeum fermentans]